MKIKLDNNKKVSEIVNELMIVRNERINDAESRLRALYILRDWLQQPEIHGKECNNRLKRNFEKFQSNYNLDCRIEFKSTLMNKIELYIYFNDTNESVVIGNAITCETVNIPRNGVNYWLNVRREQLDKLNPLTGDKEIKKELTKKIRNILNSYKKFRESLRDFQNDFNELQYAIEFDSYDSFYVKQIFKG